MSDGPLLVIEESGEVHRLYIDAAVFGRSKSCDLAFDRPGVSRQHCEIVLRHDGALVRDLGSSHGTYLDGHRVHGEAPLRRGQVVRLGPRGPRLRVMDAQLGDAPVVDDEETGAFVDPPTQAIGAIQQTETAQPRAYAVPQPPVRPFEPPTVATQPIQDAHVPVARATVISATPQHASPPPPAEAVPLVQLAPPAPKQGSFAGDLALGLLLGIAAGALLLVAVDLSPLRDLL